MAKSSDDDIALEALGGRGDEALCGDGDDILFRGDDEESGGSGFRGAGVRMEAKTLEFMKVAGLGRG